MATLIRGRLSGFLVAAGLEVAVWVSGLAPAAADPGGPVDPLVPLPAVPAPVLPGPAGSVPPPAPPVPPPAPRSLLGQVAQAVQTNPVTAMNEVLARSPQPAVLPGQPPAPLQPIDGVPGSTPLISAQLLMPKNYRMPTPDQVSPYALAPNDKPGPFARIDAWKGVHAVLHSNLGRMPGNQLGQPLPGTAPPPGTALPPGLEQFYIEPSLLPQAPDGARSNGASG